MWKTTNQNPKDLIKKISDPVDTVTGCMFIDAVDFELPGPLPLVWQRTWYSDSRVTGRLGHGARCSHEMELEVFTEHGVIGVVLADGRAAEFPKLTVGEEYFNHQEKMLLRRETGFYCLFDTKSRYAYRFYPREDSPTKYQSKTGRDTGQRWNTTNPAVYPKSPTALAGCFKQLGVSLGDITGDSYKVTQKIGNWARAKGYDGILAPSARNITGSNVIIFQEKQEENQLNKLDAKQEVCSRMGLEQYFSGEGDWEDFVNIFVDKYKNEDAYQLAKYLNDKLDIAIVIHAQIGELQTCVKWITCKIPVLENLRPIDCLKNDLLTKRLKTALMRMP